MTSARRGAVGRDLAEPLLDTGLGEPAAPQRVGEVAEHHDAALVTARAISRRDEQARALDGIAHVLNATGHPDDARRHWQEAFDLYRTLTMPKADTVRAHLLR